ncbi:MAG: hypothetical protein AABX51_08955 [Nanoarchaeota archaeon]
MNKQGLVVWAPFALGIIFPFFVGFVLYDIGFIEKFGMRPFAIIMAITSFVGTFLGFSMQRMYDDFSD